MSVIKPSLPKGTRDFLPDQMVQRQFVMGKVRSVFERYGYQPLETPSIEKLDVLSGKYGEEGEQLIFKVLRRGTGLEALRRGGNEFTVRSYSELVEEALRYDLTVPLSRVVAMYRKELVFPFKRYQIQPVWRADRPQRGRYREFYQCDVDVVGTDSMLADAEVVTIVFDVLKSLGFQNFKIRLNNRKILNAVVESAGIPPELATPVFITIDKLEKIGIEGVESELRKRELSAGQVKEVLGFLQIAGGPEEVLSDVERRLGDQVPAQEGVEELRRILEFSRELGVPDNVLQMDLCLVRGLGYYTGPIHESVVEEPKIGSLTGGGRYDKLIGMFLGEDLPATGVAFGIERIIDVMRQLDMFPDSDTTSRVLVTLFDASTVEASLRFVQALRQANIPSESFLDVVKLKKQFSYADRKKIPFVAIIGPDELNAGQVTVKDMRSGEQKTLSEEAAVEFLRRPDGK